MREKIKCSFCEREPNATLVMENQNTNAAICSSCVSSAVAMLSKKIIDIDNDMRKITKCFKEMKG